MASINILHDNGFDGLRENMQATKDKIDYLKRLHKLKLNKQLSATKRPGGRLPSMIINDFLYDDDVSHAHDLKQLNYLNIRHIICVCNLQLEKEVIDQFNVMEINLQDIDEVDIRQHFDRTNEFLHKCRSKNEKVLVHCQLGISRSFSIVLAYLLKYHHDTLYEAYGHLVER